MSKEQYLSKKYEKWDKFKDDSDDESDAVAAMPTQFDVEGDESIVIADQVLLTPQQIDKYRKLDKPHLEVWQIVVRKLRVWSASSEGADEGKDAVPCRPYCVLVNNLYPMGQVISKKIMDPPEVYPSPQVILDLTLQAMLDPPTSTPQHRPDKIVFPDKTYVGALRKSYAALGIECTYLSESQGIDTYIQELSNHLIKNDLASVAEVSLRPGLISGEGITAELLVPFYDACAKYAKLEPWKHLAERQAIQIDAREVIRIDKRHEVGRGTVFTSVIGTNTSQGQIQGLALFYTRADLERRVLPAGEKLALMENPELRRCAYCDKKAPKDSELKRCTRCKCVFYCGAECQRAHWKDHKISCVAPTDTTTETQRDTKITWGAKEMSVIFGGQTSMTFDDLDVIDNHNMPIATMQGEAMYPTPVVFKYGSPSIPTVSDLLWLTRALLGMAHMLEKHPLFMQATVGALLGLDDEQEQPKIEHACTTLGFDDHLVIRNSTVLTMQDVEKLREYVKTQAVSSEAATTNSAATISELDDEKAAEDKTDEGEETKEEDASKCAIM